LEYKYKAYMESTLTIKAMRKIVESPFYVDLTDESKQINFNGSPMSLGYWNLILSIRDVKLYSKGIKPHRFWKITDVKKYFGISGDANQLSVQLEELKSVLIGNESN